MLPCNFCSRTTDLLCNLGTILSYQILFAYKASCIYHRLHLIYFSAAAESYSHFPSIFKLLASIPDVFVAVLS